MSDNYDVRLCYLSIGAATHEVKAIYDNDLEAEAWLAGVEANYGSGYIMCVGRNQGPIDFDLRRDGADHE